MAITRHMTIAEILSRHPAAADVFRRHGMECPGCQGSGTESIESGALMHGLDPDDLLRELVRAVRGAAGRGKDT